ncbi:hypothetical protein [Hymenobacter translucens]|uniref:hypothetical protein n=1 Tax=Hymenobacter translucens TaxID=2886507 RepID=UPI00293E1D73|nr:hypothetical protein [Hymenobacter translucens]
MTLPAKTLARPAVITAMLLLVPLVAMQFTSEVNWTRSDFVFAGTILFGTGLAYELISRKGTTAMYRLAAAGALLTGFFLIWSNLAVGLIGSGPNPANLLTGGVVLVPVVGAIMVRFRPLGMVRVLLVTALAQALVPVLALLVWPEMRLHVREAVGVTGFFGALWLGSAFLFRRAGINEPERRA